MNFLCELTVENVGFESFQIKVIDGLEFHLENGAALEAAVNDGLDGVGAVRHLLTAFPLILTELLQQRFATLVTNALCRVITRALDEKRIVGVLKSRLTECGRQKVLELVERQYNSADGDALERQYRR